MMKAMWLILQKLSKSSITMVIVSVISKSEAVFLLSGSSWGLLLKVKYLETTN